MFHKFGINGHRIFLLKPIIVIFIIKSFRIFFFSSSFVVKVSQSKIFSVQILQSVNISIVEVVIIFIYSGIFPRTNIITFRINLTISLILFKSRIVSLDWLSEGFLKGYLTIITTESILIERRCAFHIVHGFVSLFFPIVSEEINGRGGKIPPKSLLPLRTIPKSIVSSVVRIHHQRIG